MADKWWEHVGDKHIHLDCACTECRSKRTILALAEALQVECRKHGRYTFPGAMSCQCDGCKLLRKIGSLK